MKNGPYELIKPPEDYPGKLYRGRYAYEHHVVWWENTGEILGEDETIHHINEDKRDNRFKNLEVISRAEHSRKHGKEQTKTMVRLKCPQCGELFTKEKRQSHLVKKTREYTSCSRSCGSKLGRAKQQGQDIDVSGNVVGFFEK